MLLAQIISEDIFYLNVHADHNHTQTKKQWDAEAKSLTAGLFLRKKLLYSSSLIHLAVFTFPTDCQMPMTIFLFVHIKQDCCCYALFFIYVNEAESI